MPATTSLVSLMCMVFVASSAALRSGQTIEDHDGRTRAMGDRSVTRDCLFRSTTGGARPGFRRQLIYFDGPIVRQPTEFSMKSTGVVDDSPEARMVQMLGGYRITQLLHVAAKLGIADELAAGPKSVEKLAETTGSHRPSLYRLLRCLASIGVFAERTHGTFEITPLASTLRSDVHNSMSAYALSCGETWWWSAFGELFHTVKTGETGFNHVQGVSFFEYLNKHPDAARVFNAIVAAYDFSGMKVLVDIGGGHGVLAAAILTQQPTARAIIVDQPAVIAGTSAVLGPLGISARCELTPGDFFVSIPSGGEIYTLKDIIHDWDDVQSTAILRNCRRAMSCTSRLLIIERLIQAGNEPCAGKLVDITMLALTGGMERTEEEYQKLLQAAGLQINRIVPLSTGGSVIEASPT
jgi:hypothetical protein